LATKELFHHDNVPSHIFFFTKEFFAKNNTTQVPRPTLLFSVSQIEEKLKSRHFDTVEVIEAESLNNFIDHDFKDAF
jgi:hypothetical protein